MLKGLKIKDRNKNIYFDSYWTGRVDYYYENEDSSGENGEDDKEC